MFMVPPQLNHLFFRPVWDNSIHPDIEQTSHDHIMTMVGCKLTKLTLLMHKNLRMIQK